MRIGIPRALLYHEYGALWKGYLERLGHEVVLSGETTLAMLQRGSQLSIDETCLSAKLWAGHVDALIGQCDVLFVPRIASFGRLRHMCTRFEALPDVTRCLFRQSGQRIVDIDVDELQKHREDEAYIGLGVELGATRRDARRAWRETVREEERAFRLRVKEEEAKLAAPGLKVLIAAHAYVWQDAYIGRPVQRFLQENGVTAIRADLIDRDRALKKSAELSPTLRWEPDRVIMGGLALRMDRADGIILMSAFPCGPGAMVNEMIRRKLTGVPML